MAKRKRGISETIPDKKRLKGGLSRGRNTQSHFDPDREWKVKSIIEERIKDKRTQYLIDWEDDEVTGQKWPPSWEPKANVNQEAVDDWEKQKAKKQSQERKQVQSRQKSNSVSSAASTQHSRKSTTLLRRSRKIVASSSQLESSPVTNGHYKPNPQETDDLLEIGESQPAQSPDAENEVPPSPLFEPEDREDTPCPNAQQLTAAVEPSSPPPSYLAGEYQKVTASQFTSSPPNPKRKSPEPSQYLPESHDTSETSIPADTTSTAPVTSQQESPLLVDIEQSSIKIVPDSQSAVETVSPDPNIQAVASPSLPKVAESIDSSGSNLPTTAEHHAEIPQSSQAFDSLPVEQDEQPAPSLAKPATEDIEETLSASASDEPTAHDQNESALISCDKALEQLSTEDCTSAEVQPELESRNQAPVTINQEPPQPKESADNTVEERSNESSSAPAPPCPPKEFSESQRSELQALSSSVLAAIPSNPRTELHQDSQGIECAVQAAQTQLSLTEHTQASSDSFASADPQANSQYEIPQGNPQGEVVANEQIEVAQHSKGTATDELTGLLPFSGQPGSVSAAVQIDLTSTSIAEFTPTPLERFQDLARAQQSSNSDLLSGFPSPTQLSRPPTADSTSLDLEKRDPISGYALLSPARQHSKDSSSFLRRAVDRPIEQTSPQTPSSPIPAVPSQSFPAHTPGKSASPAPLRFSSVSSSGTVASMDPSRSTSPGGSLREKIRMVREQAKLSASARRAGKGTSATPEPGIKVDNPVLSNASRVKPHDPPTLASPFVFARESARSPSAVPAEEPLPFITLEEMNTSARYETLLPQSQADPGEASQQHGMLATADARERPSIVDQDPETRSVHAVPIYFVGHQRDQYPAMVYLYRETIQRFLTTNHPDQALTQEARHFVERIRRITQHPDLDNAETYTQYDDVLPSQHAVWDVNCSAKFRFLRDLLLPLKSSVMRIAIIAQPGRIVDILRTFLEGIEVSHRSHDRSSAPSQHVGLTQDDGPMVIILSADIESTDVQPVDLVIAMDNSVKYDTGLVRTLRQSGSRWAPFITLVVPRTIDHVERCVSPNLSDSNHLRALVNGIYQYRDEAGRSQGTEPQQTAGSVLADYLRNTVEDAIWPLPPLHELEDLDSQTESEFEVTETEPGMLKSAIAGDKRSREPEDVDSDAMISSKRSRVASLASRAPRVAQAQDVDITHVSDSVENTTQSKSAEEPALSSVERRLQDLLKEKQDQLDEHAKVLGDLQYRYEEQRMKLLEVTTERDNAIATAQSAVSRLTEESNKMSNLRAENTAFKEQLREANGKLLEHSVPERAEFEALRLAMEQAQVEKEKANKRLEQASKEAAYVRDLYQTSSNSTQTLTARVSELQSQLAAAQGKASGEQVKLRQMHYDDFTRNLMDENRRLKTMIKDREAGLRFRDEEIAKMKEASRGRVGTRGSSIPRSPRLGSPKPGSRQTSPAPGDLRGRAGIPHPLRNG